jgi:hypothetical protein
LLDNNLKYHRGCNMKNLHDRQKVKSTMIVTTVIFSGIVALLTPEWKQPLLAAAVVTSWQPQGDSYVSEETTQNTTQIERTNTLMINQHLMNNIVRASLVDISKKQGAASADVRSYFPDDIWGETSVASLTNHSPNVVGFSNMIYQFTAGLDKRHGNLFYGAALNYAYTDVNQVANSSIHTVGITPYVAYKINDFLFASGLASYYYSNTGANNGFRHIDTHDYQTEINLNAFKVMDAFTLKGRVGMRYKHTYSDLKDAIVGRDNTFDELTGIVDAQVDYKFENGLTLFTGAMYNHYTREASGASTRVVGNDVVWMRYGAEYPVMKGLVVGAKLENDLNDKTTNYLTGSLNIRLDLN